MAIIISTNPAKGYEKLGEVEVSTDEEIKEKVLVAKKARLNWKETLVTERISLLKPICESFKERKEELAQTISKEIGKPITSSLEGVDLWISYFEDFMKQGEGYLKEEISYEEEGFKHRIVFEPWGVAAVICPWNFPFGSFI